MFDVLTRHANVIGDLVNIVSLLGPSENASAAQPMNGWVIGLVGIDIPIVLFDLGADLLLPALAEGATF